MPRLTRVCLPPTCVSALNREPLPMDYYGSPHHKTGPNDSSPNLDISEKVGLGTFSGFKLQYLVKPGHFGIQWHSYISKPRQHVHIAGKHFRFCANKSTMFLSKKNGTRTKTNCLQEKPIEPLPLSQCQSCQRPGDMPAKGGQTHIPFNMVYVFETAWASMGDMGATEPSTCVYMWSVSQASINKLNLISNTCFIRACTVYVSGSLSLSLFLAPRACTHSPTCSGDA